MKMKNKKRWKIGLVEFKQLNVLVLCVLSLSLEGVLCVVIEISHTTVVIGVHY